MFFHVQSALYWKKMQYLELGDSPSLDKNHLSRPVVAGPSNSMKRKTIVTRIWPRKFCSGWALHQDHYIVTSHHITPMSRYITFHYIALLFILSYLYSIVQSVYTVYIHQTSYTVSRTNGFHFTILRVNKQVLSLCVIPQQNALQLGTVCHVNFRHCRTNFGQISGGLPTPPEK